MDLGIAGRRALVCSVSRGLGFACALALAREGVLVTLISRNQSSLDGASAKIGQETALSPETVQADITTGPGRNSALSACPDADILVTNAGGPPSKFVGRLVRRARRQLPVRR
jgi:3-oxoacyl-[acyl-carrier protein] reductase